MEEACLELEMWLPGVVAAAAAKEVLRKWIVPLASCSDRADGEVK